MHRLQEARQPKIKMIKKGPLFAIIVYLLYMIQPLIRYFLALSFNSYFV